MANSSPFERGLLADGVLSFADYERSTFSMIDCVKERGFEVIHFKRMVVYDLNDTSPGPRLTTRGKYLFSFVGSPGSDATTLSSRVAECKRTYSAGIELLWAEHISPTLAEQQEIRDTMAECVRSAGQSVPEHPSQADLDLLAYPPDGMADQGQMAPEWFEQCYATIADEFELG
jgi:hypothetical protein